MTPKDKAKDLLQIFASYQPKGVLTFDDSCLLAKKSALMSVNMIMWEYTDMVQWEYWKSVLSEIEKL